MSDQPDNLFAAIDSLAAEEAAEEAKEITGQKDAASTPEGGQSPQQLIPSGVVVVPPDSPPPSFIEPKADLIVGATGSGKTVNLGRISDYVLDKYGLLTRMASTDPSGAGPLQGMVRSKQIEFWAPHAWPRPIEAMYKSTLGYWPLRPDDPDSPLVPPDAGTFEVYGFGAFEGLTSYGDAILDELKKTKASLSQDPSYSWSQGDFVTSGANQSYYGMMQDTLKLWVVNTHLLRYKKVDWTALESKGDDVTGSKTYGPMIGGKKATGKAGQWFVNFFHMDIIAGESKVDPLTKQSLIETKHVLFLKTHIDPLTLIPFPCKVRAPIEFVKEIPAYLESGNVAEAYRLLDTLYEKQEKSATARLNNIEGLRDRLLERAAKAKLAEAANAEKRAKASGLLKPLVTVLGGPSPSVVGGQKPSGVTGTQPAKGPIIPQAASVPSTPVKVIMPTIQNVRKKV